jgi:hypothetical protein
MDTSVGERILYQQHKLRRSREQINPSLRVVAASSNVNTSTLSTEATQQLNNNNNNNNNNSQWNGIP